MTQLFQTGMRHGLTGVLVETDPERLADACDALVLVTDWQQFQNLDYPKMATLMNNSVLIDGRNFLDREDLQRFYYVGVGDKRGSGEPVACGGPR